MAELTKYWMEGTRFFERPPNKSFIPREGKSFAPSEVYLAADVDAVLAAKDSALDFAQGAISDAIHMDEGLDGATGEACLRIIVEAIERGTFDQCDPKDLDIMTKHRRAWQDTIDWQERQLAAKDAEIARLIAANEGWHTRVSQLKADNEAYAEKLEEQDAELARVRGEHEYRVREVGELNIKLRDLQTDLEQAKAQALKYHGGLVNEQLMRSTATQRTERAEAACAALFHALEMCVWRHAPYNEGLIDLQELRPYMNNLEAEALLRPNPGQRYLDLAKLVEGLPKYCDAKVDNALKAAVVGTGYFTEADADALAALLAWRKEQP